MEPNKLATIQSFNKLKGQYVLIGKKVLRFVAIGEDESDYIYIGWDGISLSYHTILDRISQLQGKIKDAHYRELVCSANQNHIDSPVLYGPTTGQSKADGITNALKNRTKIEKELHKSIKLLSDFCWDIN